MQKTYWQVKIHGGNKMKKIAFIGGGMMAEAIIKGILSKELVSPLDLTAIDVNEKRCEYLKNTYEINTNTVLNAELKKADIIFLAVKPQMLTNAINPKTTEFIDDGALVVSIIAGKTIQTIKSLLPGRSVVRTMPNTPLAIGEGMTAISCDDSVKKEDIDFIKNIFSSCGEIVEVSEQQLDAVAGLSGSGPGYMFVIIDALADAGVKEGLPRDLAIKLAAQTVAGSGKMVLKTGKHPAELRDQVTSPGGTTIAGIAAMEKGALRSSLIEAVKVSTEKSRELGK